MPYDPTGEFEPDGDSDDTQYAGYGGFPSSAYIVDQVGNVTYVDDANHSFIETSVYNSDGSWTDYTFEPGGSARSVANGDSAGDIAVTETAPINDQVDAYVDISASGTVAATWISSAGMATEYTTDNGITNSDETLNLGGGSSQFFPDS